MLFPPMHDLQTIGISSVCVANCFSGSLAHLRRQTAALRRSFQRPNAWFWPVAILNDSLLQKEPAAQFREFNSASIGCARQQGKPTRTSL